MWCLCLEGVFGRTIRYALHHKEYRHSTNSELLISIYCAVALMMQQFSSPSFLVGCMFTFITIFLALIVTGVVFINTYNFFIFCTVSVFGISRMSEIFTTEFQAVSTRTVPVSRVIETPQLPHRRSLSEEDIITILSRILRTIEVVRDDMDYCCICLESSSYYLRDCHHHICWQCASEYIKSLYHPRSFNLISPRLRYMACPICRAQYCIQTTPPSPTLEVGDEGVEITITNDSR